MQTGKLSRLFATHKRRISLAKGNDLVGRILRKEVTEAPNSADIAGIEGESSFPPLPLESRRVERNFIDYHLEQIATTWAGKSSIMQIELGPALTDTAS
jgi:hypothetical protein